MKNILLGACVLSSLTGAALSGGLPGFEAMLIARPPQHSDAGTPDTPAAKKDLVDTLAADKQFSKLLEAVKAAGMVEALRGKGPFTIMAPTDDAFMKLPPGRLDMLLKPDGKPALQKLLKFHIMPASVPSADLIKLRESSKTLDGTTFMIASRDGRIRVGGDIRGMANVVRTDIACTNGIIHVIDSVMSPAVRENGVAMPPKEPE